MGTLSDSELISSVRDQQPRAFDRLVAQHLALVRQICARFRIPADERDDLEQEVFLKVYRYLPQFNGQSRLSTWIARIAINACLNFRKKFQPQLLVPHDGDGEPPVWEQLADDSPGPEVLCAEREHASQLSAEIDQLPTLYGLVLVLYHFNELSYREIGELLQMPDGTVKSYLFRARGMLRDRLTRRLTMQELSA